MYDEPSIESIQAAPPEALTLMLFRGAVRFGRSARAEIDAGNTAAGAQMVGRVKAIIHELESSLNHDAGPISRHLASIYEYLQRRLMVSLEDPEALDEVVTDLDEFATTWAAVVEQGSGSEALASA